jgi:hypothetical protein
MRYIAPRGRQTTVTNTRAADDRSNQQKRITLPCFGRRRDRLTDSVNLTVSAQFLVAADISCAYE